MKIGDTVRFLSSVGGGKIAGFQKGNIVLVEDEDGFQIPTLASDVVVVSEQGDDYNMSKRIVPSAKNVEVTVQNNDSKSIRSLINDNAETALSCADSADDDPSDREITFRRQVEERKGGDRLTVFLAFIPVDAARISTTQFDMYLVNDSNYFLRYNIMQVESNAWSLRNEGEIEPNTKLYIEEIGFENLNSISRLGIQFMSYKRDKSFIMKPLVDVQLRIDGAKFYKLHTFRPNDFFEQNALLFPIVENDVVACPLSIDVNTLKRQMYAGMDTGLQRDRNNKVVERKKLGVNKRNEEPIVCDLHIEELLDNIDGMSSADILQYQLDVFHKNMQGFSGKKGTKIIFIHGKGDGILRRAIIHELNYRYRQCKYQDASFQEYGYGATQVTIW